MTIQELKHRLARHGVSENLYSLEGTLLSGRMVLYKNDDKWEVFYFDERGNAENLKVFFSESDACDYIFRQLTGQDIEPAGEKQRFDARKNEIIQLIESRFNHGGKKEIETLNNLLAVLQSYTFEDRLVRNGVLSSLIKKGVFGGINFNGLDDNDRIIREIIQFDDGIQ